MAKKAKKKKAVPKKVAVKGGRQIGDIDGFLVGSESAIAKKKAFLERL